MDFIGSIKKKAKKLKKSIVFPESMEERTLQAMEYIVKEKTARPILLGKENEIKQKAEELGLKIKWEMIRFMDIEDPNTLKKYASTLYELRKAKGMTLEKAQELVREPNHFGIMTVKLGGANGMVSGAISSTANTVRPALQIIKTKKKFHKVSGIFFMSLEKRLLLFADCAINIEPNSHELADIALDTAETARRFDLVPKIAMLSFSTNRSADHPHVDKVREAVAMVKDRNPNLIVDGEMQVDTALVPHVAKRKFPNSKIQGDANILIFPSLEAGNIAYKLVERLAGARATGPILQGLNKPINDLSRGCSAHDIADLAAFTACEAQELMYEIEDKVPKIMRKRLIRQK
jgi:phosphate acetyltransferase